MHLGVTLVIAGRPPPHTGTAAQTLSGLQQSSTGAQTFSGSSSQCLVSLQQAVTGTNEMGQVYVGTYASRPAAASAAMYIPTDGPVSFASDGSTWYPQIPGAPVGTEVCPGNVSPFTTVTGGSNLSTTNIAGGCLSIVASTAGSAQNLQCWEVAYSTAQTVTAWINTFMDNQTAFRGIHIRDATGGKVAAFGIDYTSGTAHMAVNYYTNLTTYSSSFFADSVPVIPKMPLGLRIRPLGSNKYAYDSSIDGITWATIGSESLSFVPAASKCGLTLGPYNFGSMMTCLSFKVA